MYTINRFLKMWKDSSVTILPEYAVDVAVVVLIVVAAFASH